VEKIAVRSEIFLSALETPDTGIIHVTDALTVPCALSCVIHQQSAINHQLKIGVVTNYDFLHKDGKIPA
jgi:hypothetical protein